MTSKLPLGRREFLRSSSLALAVASSSRRSIAESLSDRLISPPSFAELSAVALEQARTAGATYADVRARFITEEAWGQWESDYPTNIPVPGNSFLAGFSVRALLQGYWGFCGTDGLVTIDDAARIGRRAASQAGAAAREKARPVELAQVAQVAQGRWSTPVEIDPFLVSYEERIDFLANICDYVARQAPTVRSRARTMCRRDERAFASTEGAHTQQTLYFTSASVDLDIRPDSEYAQEAGAPFSFITGAGSGWEYVRNAPYRERMGQVLEEARRGRYTKPIEAGRYELVCDASAMAMLVDQTIGEATDLERALGYRANDIGTSFLNDPVTMLGAYQLGSPLLSVTANRSMVGGGATVRWDGEGVEPRDCPLVTDGMLTNFQTTRESASWIAPFYQKRGLPVQSNGYCETYGGAVPPRLCRPNLVMGPGKERLAFEDLVKDTKRGIAIVGGEVIPDQQALTGTGSGRVMYEIIDGKIGNVLNGGRYAFRTPELWKALVAVGGAQSAVATGFIRRRGTEGALMHTVSAVPGKFRGIAVERL